MPTSVTFASDDTEKTFTFAAAADDADDDGDSVLLGFGALPDDVSAGATATSTVSITDDDVPAVQVSYGASSYSVAEGSTVTVTVELSAAPEREVEVPITHTPQDDTTAADYSGVPTSVTFASDDTAKTFTFTAAADDADDDGASVLLGFGALPDDVSEGSPDEATVTITDDPADVPSVQVSFAQASYSVAEGGTVTVTVELSAAPEREVEVPLTHAPQGDTSTADYSGVPTSVTFESDETSQTFTFTAAADDADDDSDSVLLGFGALPDDVSAGATATSTVSITDDDVPSVQVSYGASSYSVAEGGTVTVTVELSAAPEREVEVPITHTAQGDTTAADYSGVPTSVTFASDDTEKTFTFAAAADDADDDGDSVLLGFGTPLPADVTAGATDQATVSITDNDDPAVTVSFGASSYSVAEGSTVTVTVELSAAPEREVEVPITHTPQDDTTAADYSGVPTSVTFASDDTAKTFTFTAAADDADDDGDSVLLGFGTPLPDGVSEGSPGEATVSITDDPADVPSVQVSYGASSYSVAEGGTVTVTVELSAAPERTVEVPLTHTPQGDTSTADYSGVPTSVTFESDETSQTFTFTAAADDADDDSDSVLLGFGALPDDVSEGSPDEATVTITDDPADVPSVQVSFAQASYSVAEGGTVTVTVELSAAPEREVEVPITHTAQGDTTAADYSGVPTSVTFASDDTEKTFTFTAAADDADDDGDSVLLGFGTPLPADVTAGATDQATVSITDNDDPAVTVSFGASSYSVAEGSTVTVTVELSAAPERTVEIPLTHTPQGDTTTADYSGVPTSVTFASDDTEKTFTFTAAADDADDDGDSVLLGFGTPLPADVTAASPITATVSITDNDDPAVTVSFGASSYTVAEGGTVTVTVELSAAPERTVEVPLTHTPQGDTTAADYSGVPTSVTFESDDTEKTFTFTAAADDVDDDGDSVLLGFGALPDDVSEGSPGEATVSITDDPADVPAVQVSYGASSYSVAEGSTVTVTVELSAAPEREVEVPLTRRRPPGRHVHSGLLRRAHQRHVRVGRYGEDLHVHGGGRRRGRRQRLGAAGLRDAAR